MCSVRYAHGYVGCVWDWPYSNFRWIVALGVYPLDWATTLPPHADESGYGEAIRTLIVRTAHATSDFKSAYSNSISISE